MKPLEQMQFVDDFLAGQKACQDGDKCPEGASEAFVRGYNAEYAAEQVFTHRAVEADRRAGRWD